MQEIGRADSPTDLPAMGHRRPAVPAAGPVFGRWGSFARDVTETLRARFPGAIIDTHTLRWTIDQWLEEIGKIEGLVVALGVTATGLAVMGVFGVVSFAASRREHELGIRIALGARSRDIYATVIGEGVRPVVAGLICGTALALVTAIGFARVLEKLKFAVSPLNSADLCGRRVLLLTVVDHGAARAGAPRRLGQSA